MTCVGKLSGGHQAAVMCLALENYDSNSDLVVTGSKDHYIKVHIHCRILYIDSFSL